MGEPKEERCPVKVLPGNDLDEAALEHDGKERVEGVDAGHQHDNDQPAQGGGPLSQRRISKEDRRGCDPAVADGGHQQGDVQYVVAQHFGAAGIIRPG